MLKVLSKATIALALAAASCMTTAADLKVGFVNTERVLRESAPAVRAQKKLEREFEKRDADLKKADRQISDLRAVLDRDGATMSEPTATTRSASSATSPASSSATNGHSART